MKLTHVNADGRARMVDVTEKKISSREAHAEGMVRMAPATLAMIGAGGHAKGDVLGVAQVAGVMGAKRTPDLIPLCHPLPLGGIDLGFDLDENESCVRIRATVRTVAQTGVEMEALSAVTAAALTIYDMCKAVDKEMRIDGVRVTAKTKT